jgi:hypothetical protein
MRPVLIIQFDISSWYADCRTGYGFSPRKRRALKATSQVPPADCQFSERRPSIAVPRSRPISSTDVVYCGYPAGSLGPEGGAIGVEGGSIIWYTPPPAYWGWYY